MDLTSLRPVFDHPGPVATVYLESRAPSEDSAQQSRLRWQAVRGDLHDAGAAAGALDAIEAALRRDPVGEVEADGRVLVAAEDGVLLDAAWDASLGSGDFGYWTDRARLDRYVREKLTSVRLLVAVADQEGARLWWETRGAAQGPDAEDGGTAPSSSARTGVSRVEGTATVEGGGDAKVHHAREGYLSHKQNQRRADESVHRNAEDVAASLERTADRIEPDVVVLAGHVQGRTAVRERLAEHLERMCVETDRGGTQDDSAEEALAAELDAIAAVERNRRRARATDEYQSARGLGETARGAEEVARAAALGAVGTVVLSPESPPCPTSEALAAAAASGAAAVLGDLDHDADGNPVVAGAGPDTNGETAVPAVESPGGADGEDGASGIAAILRFAIPQQ